jgi:sporulation protein YlmC with PRC-barrel domain
MNRTRMIAASFVLAALMAQPAIAQPGGAGSPAAAPPKPAAGALTVPTGTVQKSQNNWRGRTLIGAVVWNDNGQRIGRVDDVLITDDGKVDQVVITVGGFLGGRKRVAVPFSQLRFGTSRLGAAPLSNMTVDGAPLVGNAADGGGNAYGVVLPGATRDTVRAMPAFAYAL